MRDLQRNTGWRLTLALAVCPIFADFSDRIAHKIDKEDFALYHDLNKGV